MTPDDPEDDRPAIRPLGKAVMSLAAAFQATGWSAGSGAVVEERTQSAGAVPRYEDSSNGLPVATRLGQFRIIALAGVGRVGLGSSAHDHSLPRRVALKEFVPSSLAARACGGQVQAKSGPHGETHGAWLSRVLGPLTAVEVVPAPPLPAAFDAEPHFDAQRSTP